jgi:peptidyl-tRNA hydrolase ICT1
MLHIFKALSKSPSRGQLAFLQDRRAYSSRSTSDSEAVDLDSAREWFRRFNKSTIPKKIAKTEFSRSSGAGGQKVNKYIEKSCAINDWLTFVKD